MKQNQLSRRALFCRACCGAFGLAGSLALRPAHAPAQTKATLTPDQALTRLKNGNIDFLADKAEPSPQDHKRRMQIARGQTPFAVLLGCSDSRVPPELLFGTGLGERSQRRKHGRYGGVGQH